MFKKFVAAAIVSALSVTAAHADDYYKDKTVTIIINLGAGGSTGVIAQLFSRYWSKYIPGNPQFVVKPVTGGEQLKGIRFVKTARPDGLTVGWLSWSAATRRIGPPDQQVNWSDFDIIAGVGAQAMAYMRKDVAPGIAKPEDITKTTGGVKIGGYSPRSFLDLEARMSLDLLGVKYNYTTGFRGGAKIVAALQRNEINFHNVPAANYFGSIDKNVVETGIGLPLWYYASSDEHGNAILNPAFGDIRPFREVVKAATGKAPSGPVWNAMQWLNNGSAGVTWLVGAPAGVDDAKVAILRDAFKKASQDPEYLAEIKKIAGLVPPIEGPESMKKIIAALADADPKIVSTLQQYMASASK